MSYLINRILKNISTRILFVLFLCVVFISSFFLISGYKSSLKLHEKRETERLKAIVRTTAPIINGDAHETLFNSNTQENEISNINQEYIYRQIQQTLNRVAKDNNLKSPLYTLVYNVKKNVFEYVVRSDNQVFFRYEYLEFPPQLLNQMKTGGTIPVYESENGSWLSAFHPIKNEKGKVVAIIEADIEFTSFKKQVNKEYLKHALVSLAFIVLISLILLLYARKILREDEEQKQILLKQKNEIQEKNRNIKHSINYALRIQNAILPSQNRFNRLFENNFVLYKPKDIVAGDFYWLQEKDENIFLAVADCTGHGVPGAMVSMICANALTVATLELNITCTKTILDKVTQMVTQQLKNNDAGVQDGMDIILCRINKIEDIIETSAANNSLYYFANNQLQQIKGDRQAIGDFSTKKPFTKTHLKLSETHSIYLSTDGMIDQFGGENGKKFKSSNFKKLLSDIHLKSSDEQKLVIETTFNNWKRDYTQIDDVCVVGIKFE